MTNDQNAVRGRHLESLAANSKRYVLEENLALINAVQAELAGAGAGSGNVVLDTVPATVDGGLWIDASGNSPVLKVRHEGLPFAVAQ